jgi:hypothetical protein
MTIARTRGVKTGRGMRAAPVLVAIATAGIAITANTPDECAGKGC